MDSLEVLKSFLEKITDDKKAERSAAVVFDLDSTLFDVSPRITKIMHDFAVADEFKDRFEKEQKVLLQTKHLPTDWGILETLVRAGLNGNVDFHREMNLFWEKHFFSGGYLKFDLPVAGAAPFVRSIYDLGHEIHYLTGRDETRMGRGTIDQLTLWNFPVNQERAHCQLKPDKDMADAPYKADYLKKLKANFDRVYFFENEPVIVNHARQACPEIDLYFMDVVHSGQEEIIDGVKKIKNFVV